MGRRCASSSAWIWSGASNTRRRNWAWDYAGARREGRSAASGGEVFVAAAAGTEIDRLAIDVLLDGAGGDGVGAADGIAFQLAGDGGATGLHRAARGRLGVLKHGGEPFENDAYDGADDRDEEDADDQVENQAEHRSYFHFILREWPVFPRRRWNLSSIRRGGCAR